MKTLSLLIFVTILTGCVSVSNVKTLTVPQSDRPVTVVGRSQAKCYDIFFVMWCQLFLELESDKGQKVTDFPQR